MTQVAQRLTHRYKHQAFRPPSWLPPKPTIPIDLLVEPKEKLLYLAIASLTLPIMLSTDQTINAKSKQ